MKKSAIELVRHLPGVAQRRQEIIVALCQGTDMTQFATLAEVDSIGYAILRVANTIIEETEQ